MRTFVIVALTMLVAGNAYAVTGKKTPQQEKMGACATQNKGKKGAEYKQAMSDCMKGDMVAAPAKPLTQNEKMSACAKENKGKKGDEYKQAMSACLSK
jgi:hypothetical protein